MFSKNERAFLGQNYGLSVNLSNLTAEKIGQLFIDSFCFPIYPVLGEIG